MHLSKEEMNFCKRKNKCIPKGINALSNRKMHSRGEKCILVLASSDFLRTDAQRRIRSSSAASAAARLRRRMNHELNFPPNFERLVLGCINADFCK